MSLENSLFQLKFTAKQLTSQSKKASKERKADEARVKKMIQQGNPDLARVYASNAVRKANESISLLRLAARIDAVASRVQTAITMRSVTGNMAQVVRGMNRAMESMQPDKIAAVMDTFESQFEDMDVQSGYMDSAMGDTAAISAPAEDVDALMQKMADEAGVETNETLAQHSTPSVKVGEKEEDELHERLRSLVNPMN